MDVVFLDYSKAFDSASHPKLPYKLRQYVFSDALCKFMSAFLYNKRQCVRVNNAVSSFVDVYSEVPEGSCFGPLLYDLYVNDLCHFVKYSKIILFADDARLYISSKYSNATDLLNIDLRTDNVANWSRLWQLKLNIKKCCAMHIGHYNPKNAYYINGSQ